jgi:outer membrane autotransporter protein
MRLRRGLFACAGLLFLALPASAQDNDEDEPCEFLRERQEIEQPELIPACLGPITNRESLLTISHLVHRLVADELLGDRERIPEPAGLIINGPDDIRTRLSRAGTIRVAPAADATVPAPQRRWNVWVDGKYSWIDGQFDLSDSDGPLVNITSGLDYKISDSVVFGLLFSYENSELKTSGILSKIGTETEGLGGGAYLGVTLTDHIVFSALVNGTFIDNDYDLFFSTASTDSERLQTSAGFTGYYYSSESWRWSPSLTAAWSGEWIDSYHDSLGNDFGKQKSETAVLSFGNQLGKTFALGDGASVEPWAGAILEYTFLNQTHTDDAEDVDFPETVDMRYQLGLNINFAENVQLALTGEAAGFMLDESNTYAGEANLAIQF